MYTYIFSNLSKGVQALGCASYFTAALSILTNTWGKRTALAMGFYEISTGLGMIIGPLLGGCLYNVGGFGLPFWVVGGILFLGAILNYITLPKVTFAM
jgi:MFS family permease